MTNYERIKNMSAEKLAVLLSGICPYALEEMTEEKRAIARKMCLSGIGCDKCRIKWLNSEVGE